MARLIRFGLISFCLALAGPSLAQHTIGRAFSTYPGKVESVQDIIVGPGRTIVRLDGDGLDAGALTEKMNAMPDSRLAQAVIVEFDTGERKEIIVPADVLLAAGDRVNCLAGADGWKVQPVEQTP